MVAKAWHAGPMQRRRTKYLQAIVHFRYLRPHGTQIVRDCSDAIAFFYAQLFRVPNNRLPVRKSASDCKDRQLIDKLRYYFTMNDSTLKRENGKFDNYNRFNLIDGSTTRVHF